MIYAIDLIPVCMVDLVRKFHPIQDSNVDARVQDIMVHAVKNVSIRQSKKLIDRCTINQECLIKFFTACPASNNLRYRGPFPYECVVI